MNRVFLVLAAAATLLLLAVAALGVAALSASGGVAGWWRLAHGQAGLASLPGVLAVLATGAIHLRGGCRRVSVTVREGGLPPWLMGQADKAARRAGRLRVGCVVLMVAAVLLGLADGASGAASAGHVGVGAAALPFALGALAAEVVAVAQMTRVHREAGRWRRRAEDVSVMVAGSSLSPARDDREGPV